jgi:hypothetical protein
MFNQSPPVKPQLVINNADARRISGQSSVWNSAIYQYKTKPDLNERYFFGGEEGSILECP